MDNAALRDLWQRTLASIPDGVTLPSGATFKPTKTTAPITVLGASTLAKAGGSADPIATIQSRPAAGGSRIAASFEMIEEIGYGGMGIVHRACQTSLDRTVAVKRVNPAPPKRPPLTEVELADARAAFVVESHVTGFLDHPNIVPVYELGRPGDGDVFLAMKLVAGVEWRLLLHPETDAQSKLAASYDVVRHIGVLLNVCNALAFAHSRNIIHRDLKPSQVMVGEFGEVLLMDWGLAADCGDDPKAARAPHRSTIDWAAGTPCYMAPELAEGRGNDMGPWTDVYLLGAILHEILTGAAPHGGSSLLEVVAAASRSEPPSYSSEIPAELRAVCLKAMAQQPSARYATVKEFQSALQDHLKHRESTIISTAARETLAKCEVLASSKLSDRSRLYAAFAEALAGFRQAGLLWSGNAEAIAGERRARLAYATTALEVGDLGLAEAQAPTDDETLREQIRSAHDARVRATQRARTTRWALGGAVVVIVIGLTASLIAVNAERAKTLAEKIRADRQRDLADANERSAIEQRDRLDHQVKAAAHLREARKELLRLEKSLRENAFASMEAAGRRDAALDWIEKALKEDAENAEALVEKAGLATIAEDLNGAEDLLSRAIASHPLYFSAYLERAIVRCETYEELRHSVVGDTVPKTRESEVLIKGIREDIQRVRELAGREAKERKLANAYLRFAEVAGEGSGYLGAAEAFEQYADQEDDFRAWLHAGHAYVHVGTEMAKRQAIRCLERAIALRGKDCMAYHFRGKAYIDLAILLGSRDQLASKDARARAMGDRDMAIELNLARSQRERVAKSGDLGMRAQVRFVGGLAGGIEKALDQGLEDTTAALKLDPDNASALHLQGFLHLLRKDYTTASGEIARALILDRDRTLPNLRDYLQLLNLLRSRAKSEREKEELDRMIKVLREFVPE